jgi:hypothetical protein
VFLLLLCNDRQVLGPWVNRTALNVFTAAVIAVLVMLSIVLTASVLFPAITSAQIVAILATGTVLALAAGGWMVAHRRRTSTPAVAGESVGYADGVSWRMPPLAVLSRPSLSTGRRLGLSVLRVYLVIACALVVVRVVQLAFAH